MSRTQFSFSSPFPTISPCVLGAPSLHVSLSPGPVLKPVFFIKQEIYKEHCVSLAACSTIPSLKSWALIRSPSWCLLGTPLPLRLKFSFIFLRATHFSDCLHTMLGAVLKPKQIVLVFVTEHLLCAQHWYMFMNESI